MTLAAQTRREGAQAGRQRTYALLLAPSVVLVLLVNGYPVLVALWQTTRNSSLLSSRDFVGFGNFVTLAGIAGFWDSLAFTAVFVIVGVFGSWAVGFAIALTNKAGVPGSTVFRTLLLLPWVVPIVVTAISWQRLLGSPSSPLPSLLESVGIDSPSFLGDPGWAAVVVCVVKVWLSFPFMMVMMQGALEGVDASVYEAARIDGATWLQSLRFVTLPLTASTTYVAWIMMAVFCMNDFTTIWLITGGGPLGATRTLIVYAYELAFQEQRLGLATTVGILAAVVMSVVAVILFRLVRKAKL